MSAAGSRWSIALRRFLKFLHELGSVGLLGTLAAHLILIVIARREAPAQALVLRRCMVALVEWAMVPSVLVVVFSGLIATFISRQLRNALWVWLKVGLGIPVAQVCLGPVRSGAREAAALMAQALAGHPDPEALGEALYREWAGLWMVIVISLLNIALAVWRPRMVTAKS